MKELKLTNAIEIDSETLEEPNYDAQNIQNQYDEIFDEITYATSAYPDLEYINLKGDCLRTKELNKLAEILQNFKMLKTLNLSYNLITVDSLPSIKKIILDHPNLKTLYLDANRLTDEFIHALIKNNSEELKQRLRFINLSLSGNRFLTVNSIHDTENKLHRDSRLTMLVGNDIDDSLDTEYREKIEQTSKLSQPASAFVQIPVAAASAPFTPLKGTRVISSIDKPDNRDHSKVFEKNKAPAKKI